MPSPKISLLIHTISKDDFMAPLGIPSAIVALVDNLNQQTFKDFELVYIDYWRAQNAEKVALLHPQFVIKHVEVQPSHRYWFNRHNYHISAAKNTGILYADGQLCITVDDGEFYPRDFLETYWNHFVGPNKLYCHARHFRYHILDTKNGLVKLPLNGPRVAGHVHEDKRMNGRQSPFIHNIGTWMFAGTSFALEHALRINGFNERMDGYKSLEDCDFGIRLANTGANFVMDNNCWLAILMTPHYSNDPEFKFSEFIALENYGVVQWARELGENVANKGEITQKHLQCVKAHTLKYRSFDPLGPENADKLRIWMGTPTFDLAEERRQLRASPDWKW